MKYVFSVESIRHVTLVAVALGVTACGQSPAPGAQTTPGSDASAMTDSSVGSGVVADGANSLAGAADSAADAATMSDQAATLAAKEADLAEREAAVALQEREAQLARREAELAAQRKAAVKQPAKPVAAKPPKAVPVVAAAAPVPQAPMLIASGTSLSIELVNPLSSKTATVGDRVDGRLSADVMVDGKTALPAGTPVQGSVTEVISGSKTIGGTPTLGLVFDQLDLANGGQVSFNANLHQVGKSDKGRDTAKIAGGAVAGAIVGHQVDGDKGKIIGGILGGAAGAIAAKKTGGDVTLPAGTVVIVQLTGPLEIKSK